MFVTSVSDAAYQVKIAIHQRSQRVVGQHVVTAVDQLHLHASLGGERAGLCAFHDAIPDSVQNRHAGMASVQKQLSEIRHDIRRRAAVRDDVVDASGFGYVFAQELDSVGHHHEAVQRGAAQIGRRGRVSGLAVKTELGGGDGKRALLGSNVGVAGMPAQYGIDILKHAGSSHV